MQTISTDDSPNRLYKPWAIFCTSKVCQQYECIGRYFNRQDAEDHLTFLRRRVPQAKFVLAQEFSPGVHNNV